MFHQILRFEMGARLVLASGAVDDGEFAFLPGRLQIVEEGIQAEEPIEWDRGLLGDRDARPRPLVSVVLDRRHQAQAIRASA